MKTYTRIALFSLITLAPCGCEPEKRIVWSPDGQWAAVRTDAGLFLCDVEGHLYPQEDLGRIRHVAWLPDSERLLLVVEEPAATWAELIERLDEGEVERLTDMGRHAVEEIEHFDGSMEELGEELEEHLTGGEIAAVLLYVRDHPTPAVRERLAEHWDDLEDAEVPVQTVALATRDGTQVRPEHVLGRTVSRLGRPAISPDGRSFACGRSMSGDPPTSELYVMRLEDGEPRHVAERVAGSVAWSADGRHLVYVQASAVQPTMDDAVHLGVIARQEICDDAGFLLEEFGEPEYLAGILFDPQTRVRCMRDGRIVFATVEVSLPCSGRDMPTRPTLFAVDPGRSPVVARLIPRQTEAELPAGGYLFELSPDGSRVCIPGEGGRLVVVDLASGDYFDVLPEDAHEDPEMQPVWRMNDELCFTARPPDCERPDRLEVVMIRLNENGAAKDHRILSKDWPDDAVRGFLVPEEKAGADEHADDEDQGH